MSFFEMYLRVGQTLYCNNGEKVTVKNIDRLSFTVEYKGKQYERPNSILGKKLHFNLASLNKKYLPVEVEVICYVCRKPFKAMCDREWPVYDDHLCPDCNDACDDMSCCKDCGDSLSNHDIHDTCGNYCIACYDFYRRAER